jgi:hypothetical protein
MNPNKKLALVTSLATLVVGLVLVLGQLLLSHTFTQTDKMQVLVDLSDSFFISGFIIFGIGGLLQIAQTGFFDILAYGIKSIGVLFLKITYKKGDHEKYYEYVERKRELRKNNPNKSVGIYLILVGALLILVAIIFLPFIK